MVYAPGLLGPYTGQEQWQATDWPTLTQVQKFLSRADRLRSHHVTSDDYATIFSYFNLDSTQDDLPLAALSLLAEGLTPANDYWLRLDPVCLRADRSDAILIAHESLALTETEAAALQEAIRPLLDDWDASLQSTSPHHWYVRLPRQMALSSTPLVRVKGQAISRHMPLGNDHIQWHRFMNEVQMTWHAHPVNQQREQEGRLIASSVWPWGGGVLPEQTTAQFDRVYSNDLIVKGLANLHDIDCLPLEQAVQGKISGRLLMVDLSWRELQQQQDAAAWFDALAHWQVNVLQPIGAKLEANRLLHVTFDFGGQYTYALNRKALHRWWRRTKSLQQLILTAA